MRQMNEWLPIRDKKGRKNKHSVFLIFIYYYRRTITNGFDNLIVIQKCNNIVTWNRFLDTENVPYINVLKF